jgi:hypothetical protein
MPIKSYGKTFKDRVGHHVMNRGNNRQGVLSDDSYCAFIKKFLHLPQKPLPIFAWFFFDILRLFFPISLWLIALLPAGQQDLSESILDQGARA